LSCFSSVVGEALPHGLAQHQQQRKIFEIFEAKRPRWNKKTFIHDVFPIAKVKSHNNFKLRISNKAKFY